MLYERQIDPVERPTAICPLCHRNTILCDVNVLVSPETKVDHAVIGLVWGNRRIANTDKAICNSHGCGWAGMFKEAKDAVEGTVEAVSNGRGFRIWVKPSELV
jgi:hypothetical protein